MDGNKVLEYLQGMSEDERSICQLDWLISPNRVREYVLYSASNVLLETGMAGVDDLRDHLIEYADYRKLSATITDAFVDTDVTVRSKYLNEFNDNFRIKLCEMLKEEAQVYLERRKKK